MIDAHTVPQPPQRDDATTEIAIVGIACALPSGEHSDRNLDYHTLWDFLINKSEAYEEIPKDRFNIQAWHGTNLGQVKTMKGAFLKESTLFDHLEFGIPFKDALAMSPSTRRLIELSFLALLDSGVDYRGKPVGCFMSGTNPGLLDQDEYDMQGSFAGLPTMISNRVSYALDISGPSVSLDTACSSSLTATHLAIQSILAGDCETALVGGCQYNHSILDWLNYSQGGVLAPDGKCKPFDASGDGFARGEGAAIIVLKRLADAIRDNDRIYATILGSAINSTGGSSAPNVPVGSAQQTCIQRAFDRAQRTPKSVDYVELHATGTAVGDPIEANAAGQIFRRDHEVAIGSIKGNIGHLEITAFLASLIKTCLIFEKGEIPPQANLSTSNPAILWDAYGLNAPRTLMNLPCHSSSGRALASISSYGIGGSNGCVVLESPPPNKNQTIISKASSMLLIAGALSPRSTDAIAASMAQIISEQPEETAAVCLVSARRARQMNWRTFAILRPGSPLVFPGAILVPRKRPFLAFVISGQGPQYPQMGRQFYQSSAVFRQSIHEMDVVYETITGASLLATTGLFSASSDLTRWPELWPIALTLPALSMFHVALIDMLRSAGVYPDAVMGHSAGETALLYACGAASKAMVVELAIARGLAMSIVEKEGGTMAALACSPWVAKALIAEVESSKGTVELACHNSPEAVALSGPRETIERVVALAGNRNIWARLLRTNVPVHCSMMEACRDDYQSRMETVFSRHASSYIPSIETYSTLTGATFSGPFTASYFWNNALKPVLFTEAVSCLQRNHPDAIFIEISPHPVLAQYITTICGPECRILTPSRRRSTKELFSTEKEALLECLGNLSVLGLNSLDVRGLDDFQEIQVNYDVLSPYPFTVRHVPFHADAPAFYFRQHDIRGPLNHANLRISAETHPDLAQHVIQGQAIMPAAGFLEMAFEFGARQLWDVKFKLALSLSSDRPIPVQISQDGNKWAVRSNSVARGGPSVSEVVMFDRLHAEGRMSYDVPARKASSDYGVLQEAKVKYAEINVKSFYSSLDSFSNFGPTFRRIEKLYQRENEIVARIIGLREDDQLLPGYRFSPAVLDACFQATFLLTAQNSQVFYLPAGVGHVTLSERLVSGGLPPVVIARITLVSWTPTAAIFDILILTEDSLWLCSLKAFEMASHRYTEKKNPSNRFEFIWQPLYIPLADHPGNVIHKKLNETDSTVGSLYKVLDHLAEHTIKKSLRAEPIPGQELDRQRYFDFAVKATRGSKNNSKPNMDQVDELRDRWPVHFEITERIAQVHQDVLMSSKAAVNALYKDDIMTKFYSTDGEMAPVCEASAMAFREILSAIVASGKKVIRVLEVGTGTGLLTTYLEPILIEFQSVFIEYFATDVSMALASQAMHRFSYPHIRAQSYDISRSPAEQGFLPGSFDVVTGLHVLHAAPVIRDALLGVDQLLVPGGSLLFVDLNGSAWPGSPGTKWLDFLFGSFAEWFSFEDTDVRSHCTMSIPLWEEVLRSAGFAMVTSSTDSDSGLHFFAHAQKRLWGHIERKPLPNEIQDGAPVQVVHYRVGDEMQLQKHLSGLSPELKLTVWLLASDGPDGDALLGLARSLAREYPSWDLHFGVFAGNYTVEQQEEVLQSCMPSLQAEPEVFFNCKGLPTVARIVSSSAPKCARPFEPSKPWVSESGTINHTSFPHLVKDYAIVSIAAWSSSSGHVKGFVGMITEAGDTEFRVDDIVWGLTMQPYANFIVVQSSCLAAVPTAFVAADYGVFAHVALPLCVAYMVTAPWRRRRISSAPCMTALILSLPDSVDETVRQVLRQLRCIAWDEDALLASNSDNRTTPKASLDVVVGSTGDIERLQGLPKYRRFLAWDDPVEGIEALLTAHPRLLREGMESIVDCLDISSLCVAVQGPPLQLTMPPTGHPVPYKGALFDHKRSYLLVGGLGGLGVRIAIWMYEHGARNLILTSRSGPDSVSRLEEPMVSKMLKYLMLLEDLNLRLEACDATSPEPVRYLMNSIHPPLAGCMLMPLVLSDRLFVSQTEEDFQKVYASKCLAFKLLSEIVDLEELDFCITFSSVAGLLGNGGQTNYASACTGMDALTRPFTKAFTLIVPGITDAGRLARDLQYDRRAASHLAHWGLTCEDLCSCIEDGILKLSDGPFTYYIPDIDWVAAGKAIGISTSFRHLASPARSDKVPEESESNAKTALDIVRDFLQVPPEEFSADVPLTQYGLDSLAAVRLSATLRPFGVISQLQLLGDMSLNNVLSKFAESDANPAGTITGSKEELARLGESVSDETIVRLRDEATPPLIIIHGGGGSIQPFHMLKENFHTSLWAIQVTADTPLTSIEALAKFYFLRIKALRPHGPYRIATFSASSIVGICLAKLFEAGGDHVIQLALLDHFPSLVFAIEEDLTEILTADDKFKEPYIAICLETMQELFGRDTKLRGRELLSEELGKSLRGEAVPRYVLAYRDRLLHFMSLVVRCALSCTPEDKAKAKISPSDRADYFIHWLSGLRAPISLYLASNGMQHTIPAHLRAPLKDLGIRSCYPTAKIYEVAGGHFDILSSEAVAELLQTEWQAHLLKESVEHLS